MELSAPYKLTYIVTYRCGFKCVMCGIGQRGPSAREMTIDEVRETFGRYRGFSWINLSGGEPLMRPDFVRLVRTIDEQNPGVYLLDFPTNGFLVDEAVSAVREILGACGFKKVMVTVSLDGPPLVHDRIRGVAGSWDRAVETFRRLRALRDGRFNVFFGMTLQAANAGLFDRTVNEARARLGSLEPFEFHVNVAHSGAHYYGNAGFDNGTDKTVLWNDLKKIDALQGGNAHISVRLMERLYRRLARRYLQEGRTPVRCQALSASVFVDPGGMVYPCSIYDRPVGWLGDHQWDMRRLWLTDERFNIRRDITEGRCPQCWTPCEAYQSILGSLVPSVLGALRP